MRVNYTENRISIGEAAEMLGMSEQRVRVLMQRGKLPIGIADKSEKAECNYTYYIYKDRVTAYMNGMDIAAKLLENLLNDNETKDVLKEFLKDMLSDTVKEIFREFKLNNKRKEINK